MLQRYCEADIVKMSILVKVNKRYKTIPSEIQTLLKKQMNQSYNSYGITEDNEQQTQTRKESQTSHISLFQN